VAMTIATIVFLYGTPLYRCKVPGGSPINHIAQVVVSAIRKKRYWHAFKYELASGELGCGVQKFKP